MREFDPPAEGLDPLAALDREAKRQAAEEAALEKHRRVVGRFYVLGASPNRAFLTALALQLEPKVDWEAQTAWTDGKNIGFNPDFVGGLSDTQWDAVTAHEILHVACLHHVRRGDRDPELANIACLRGDALVLGVDGSSRRIENLAIGDTVIGIRGGKLVRTKVLNVTSKYAPELVSVRCGEDEVLCTPEHLFLTSDGYVEASQLGSSGNAPWQVVRFREGVSLETLPYHDQCGVSNETWKNLQLNCELLQEVPKDKNRQTQKCCTVPENECRDSGLHGRYYRRRGDGNSKWSRPGPNISSEHVQQTGRMDGEQGVWAQKNSQYKGAAILEYGTGRVFHHRASEEAIALSRYQASASRAGNRVYRSATVARASLHALGADGGDYSRDSGLERAAYSCRVQKHQAGARVYDITTCCGSFIANGFVVHNCDLAINSILVDANFDLPACRLLPGEGEYKDLPPGLGFEDYYARLQQARNENPGKQGNGAPQGGGAKGDPGGCGEVRDGGSDASSLAEAEANAKVMVARAEQAAKAKGELGAGLERMTGAALRPPSNWKDELRDFVSQKAKEDYCVAPETLVLNAELKWVTAGSLKPGDRLLTVEEYPASGRCHRRMCEAVVQGAYIFEAPRMVMENDKGPPIVSTLDHKYLAATDGSGNRWVKAKRLKVGRKVKFLVDPWSDDRSDSWLAGMYDGEGYLTANPPDRPRSGVNLGIAQTAGPVLDRVLETFDSLGLNAGQYVKPRLLVNSAEAGRPVSKKDCYSIGINRLSNILRLLGVYRPIRLLTKFQHMMREKWFTFPRPGKATITKLERVGDGPVVSLKTSTGTLITNGVVSHNCWAHPNRRFIAQDLYLPGLHSETLGTVAVAVDCSGSIDETLLAEFGSELQDILSCFPKTKLHTFYHDVDVHKEEVWSSEDGELKLSPVGGGGTSHVPVFERMAAMDEQPACIVCLTDCYTTYPTSDPGAPVLWACFGNDGANPPFGRVIHVR